MLPFLRNFDKDPNVKKDPGRKTKLLAEKEGALALFVRAGMEYLKNGLQAPASVISSRDQYREDMDLTAEWLEACCEVGSGYSEPMSRLWTSWEMFAKNRGTLNYIKSATVLGRRLDQKFPAKKGTGGIRVRVGLRLKADFPGENP